MKLIDKDTLLAELDRQKIGYNVDSKHSVEYDITRKIIDIINTIEVKEVDLGGKLTWKEMAEIVKIANLLEIEWLNNTPWDGIRDWGFYTEVLKRFKAQKG